MKNSFLCAVAIVSLLISSLFATTAVAQTRVDPNAQINWSIPITNAPGPQAKFINGTAMADQFPGAPDACLQVLNAEIAVLTASNGAPAMVDASHITGTVQCHTNMFGGLDSTIAAPLFLQVKFGPVILQSTVEQEITNSSITVEGAGRTKTVIEYTNSSAPTDGAVMYTHAQDSGVTNGLTDVTIRGMGFLGNSHVTNALIVKDTNRSQLHDVLAWGASNDAIFAEGDVTTTWDNVKESEIDANVIGSFPAPLNGIEFAKSFASNNSCTSSTVTDNAAEFLSGTGWKLTSANNMVFTGGTSEINLRGITVAMNNKWNSFIGSDLEGNSLGTTGGDVEDSGQSNHYIGVLASSACSACNSVHGGGNGGQIWYGDGGSTGEGGSFSKLNNNPTFLAPEGTFSVWNFNAVSVTAPIFTSDSGAPTLIPGTGITSITCDDPGSSGLTCTSSRGIVKVVNSSATTTSSFAEIVFATVLATKPSCQVTQAGGTATSLGLFVSAVSTAQFFIANTASLSGVTTLYLAYSCQL